MAIGAIAWQRLAATLPPASDDNQRRPPQVWGQGAQHRAGSRAADLARCEFERRRLMRIMTERYGRPSLDRLARKASLSFKANGDDAFASSRPCALNIHA
jgi:hypothetical protein